MFPIRAVSSLFLFPPMDTLNYPEPPTESSISAARRALETQRQTLSQLSERITQAEDALAQIVADRKRTIREMQREQHALEDQVKHTLAYISPIRRLPHELLRHIFLFNFDNHPCCAWVLASVSVQWRRLALSIPRLWSKVSASLSCPTRLCGRVIDETCLATPHRISPTDTVLYLYRSYPCLLIRFYVCHLDMNPRI